MTFVRSALCAATLAAGTLLAGLPGVAAGRLVFTYGPASRSIKVESLETFAATGQVNDDLRLFIKGNDLEQQKKYRKALTFRASVKPILVSRFLNTHIGEEVLTRLGKAITLNSGANGKLALRSALVEAAYDKDGLSVVNVMKKLPVDITFNGKMIIDLAAEVKRLVLGTEELIKTFRSSTEEEAKTSAPVDYSQLPDMSQSGPYTVEKRVWNLVDSSRQRKFYVDVYLPVGSDGEKLSVIVFSHGLSSRPEDYSTGLRHMASHGYAVAAPQHPGSDNIWIKELIKGINTDVFDVNEYINRPADISYVLDELQRRNAAEFEDRLVLDNVGIAGHSFGGYTALAVGGARVDFEHLKQECERTYGGVDVSILLECEALRLPQKAYDFKDDRVSAIFAFNPVNRAIFGPKGLASINLPTAMSSGSYDPAAPPALEQASSFTWLKMPDKYWMMVEGQAHVNFDNIDPGIKRSIEAITDLTIPSEALIVTYVKAMVLPFFKVHVDGEADHKVYLRSAYAEYLSRGKPFKLDFVTAASSDRMRQAIINFQSTHPSKAVGTHK